MYAFSKESFYHREHVFGLKLENVSEWMSLILCNRKMRITIASKYELQSSTSTGICMQKTLYPIKSPSTTC